MIKNFRLDHKGLAQILKSSSMQAAVATAAEKVASGVRSSTGAKVTLTPHQTDRSRVTVTVEDGDSRAELIAAARAAGLQVHEYDPQ